MRVPTDEDGYYDVITKPMCFEMKRHNAVNSKYTSTKQLADDIELMKVNCHAWCASRYPDLLPVADRISKLAGRLLSKIDAHGMPVLLGKASGRHEDLEVSFVLQHLVNNVAIAAERPKFFVEFSNGWLIQRESVNAGDGRRHFTACDGAHFKTKSAANAYAEEHGYQRIPVPQNGRQRRSRRGRKSDPSTPVPDKRTPGRRTSARVSAKDVVTEPSRIDEYVVEDKSPSNGDSLHGVSLKKAPGNLRMTSGKVGMDDVWEWSSRLHGVRDEAGAFTVCLVSLSSRFKPFVMTPYAWEAYNLKEFERMEKARLERQAKIEADNAARRRELAEEKRTIEIERTVTRCVDQQVRLVVYRLSTDMYPVKHPQGSSEETRAANKLANWVERQKRKIEKMAHRKSKDTQHDQRKAKARDRRLERANRAEMQDEDFASAADRIVYMSMSGMISASQCTKRRRELRFTIMRCRSKNRGPPFIRTFSPLSVARDVEESARVAFLKGVDKYMEKVRIKVGATLKTMVNCVAAGNKMALVGKKSAGSVVSIDVRVKLDENILENKLKSTMVLFPADEDAIVMVQIDKHWWPANVLTSNFNVATSLLPSYRVRPMYEKTLRQDILPNEKGNDADNRALPRGVLKVTQERVRAFDQFFQVSHRR